MSLITDTYVDNDIRQNAMAVARLMRGEKYEKLLIDLADQADLEGTPLLAEVRLDLLMIKGVLK